MSEAENEISKILYQQLQLLVEKIDEEESIYNARSMIVDFRHIAKTILTNNPTEEQRKWILERLNNQIKMLSEKKSVYLSDVINDSANFIFQFF